MKAEELFLAIGEVESSRLTRSEPVSYTHLTLPTN